LSSVDHALQPEGLPELGALLPTGRKMIIRSARTERPNLDAGEPTAARGRIDLVR
jgi:hypothetical protein